MIFSKAYVSMQHTVIIDYSLHKFLSFIFSVEMRLQIGKLKYLNHLNHKRKRNIILTTCSCPRIIHYTSGVLVKIMH